MHSTSSGTAQLTLGQLGEALVAEWLEAQGVKILHRRWHCRWGELDLVALLPEALPCKALASATQPTGSPLVLAFIEVKTRSRDNWDEGGLLAITPSKQRKIWHSARLYLAQYPRFANFPCRCDVALVGSQRLKKEIAKKETGKQEITKKKTALSLAVQDHEPQQENPKRPPTLGQPIQRGDYRLTLQHYLADAFQLD
ncbi:MAG: YraN family protein [Synechococcales cyanobacterium RU_4_20]|nr:YraN family protein [Synechococcales cyanobacterium RU_4_20]NJR69107.1 YraN family protein [Synechococcales cyanobacterium CRU_2_2]